MLVYNQPILRHLSPARSYRTVIIHIPMHPTTQIVYLPHSASGLSCDRGGMDTSRSIHYNQCCVEEQGASNQTLLWQRGALAFDARGRTRWWVWEWNQEHCPSGMNYFSVHRLCGFICLYDLGVQTLPSWWSNYRYAFNIEDLVKQEAVELHS